MSGGRRKNVYNEKHAHFVHNIIPSEAFDLIREFDITPFSSFGERQVQVVLRQSFLGGYKTFVGGCRTWQVSSRPFDSIVVLEFRV